MKKVKLIKDFSFSNDGINVVQGKKGDSVEVNERVYSNMEACEVIGKVKGGSPAPDPTPEPAEEPAEETPAEETEPEAPEADAEPEAPAEVEEKEVKGKNTKEVKKKKTKGA